LTTPEVGRRIATQVLKQAQQRVNSSSQLRGVEQVHSTILHRRQEADTTRTREATEVFEKGSVAPDGESTPEVVTVDFLRKYIRYCKRLTPYLSEEAKAVLSDRYVDLRMRFQSGIAGDLDDPDSKQKPRLAVTTRTLEALIRLATAHAKLKLRRDHVLPEDVEEAYKLMLAAREEEPATTPAVATIEPETISILNEGSTEPTSRKRQRQEDDEAARSVLLTAISPGRLSVMSLLLARSFVRKGKQVMSMDDLLQDVNSNRAEGERQFDETEFDAGLIMLERQDKIFRTGSEVYLIS